MQHAIAAADTEHEMAVRPAFPVMAVVFASFLVIGMALPVLPLHVHDVLGFGPFVVGLVTGCQFVAALVSRLWAGRLSDSRGPRAAVLVGLAFAIGGGILYLASLQFLARPNVSVALLLGGRTLIGGAESLIITGGIAWALGLVDPRAAARSIAWTGMAMFAALAVGAPIGSTVYAATTFEGIAMLTVVISAVAIVAARSTKAYHPTPAPPRSFRSVMWAVALPGVGFALSGITFGVMTAFLTLFFAVEHWAHGALAFTAFAISLIAVRVVAGHLPDRFGGGPVAFYSLAAQATGLIMVGAAPDSGWAIAGSIIAGAGFSLVFPSLGLEAVKRAPAGARGLAMGVYNAYLDLTLGIAAPALGLVANIAGLRSVFFVSAVAALTALPIARHLARRPTHGKTVLT